MMQSHRVTFDVRDIRPVRVLELRTPAIGWLAPIPREYQAVQEEAPPLGRLVVREVVDPGKSQFVILGEIIKRHEFSSAIRPPGTKYSPRGSLHGEKGCISMVRPRMMEVNRSSA